MTERVSDEKNEARMIILETNPGMRTMAEDDELAARRDLCDCRATRDFLIKQQKELFDEYDELAKFHAEALAKLTEAEKTVEWYDKRVHNWYQPKVGKLEKERDELRGQTRAMKAQIDAFSDLWDQKRALEAALADRNEAHGLDVARLAKLEKERDELQAKLNTVIKAHAAELQSYIDSTARGAAEREALEKELASRTEYADRAEQVAAELRIKLDEALEGGRDGS